jgi:hypothetical protein
LIKNNIIVMGVCMPRSLKEAIDRRRGDIPRSKYISRILERQIIHEKQNGNDLENQQSKSRPQPGQNSSANSPIFPPTNSEAGAADGQV